MERIDCHTHTYLSNHGRGTVDEVVSSALSKGLTMVALTEHLPLPDEFNPDGTFAMDADKVDLYLEAIESARRAHPQIEIISGIEVDWRVGAEDYILERIEPFELLLGSVHMLTDELGNSWPFDHPDFIEGWYQRGEEQVWQQYLDLWIQAVSSSASFDIMTHPDLPKKLGFKPSFDARELYHAMAEAAAKHDVMIEVNTSGLRKTVRELYPAPDLLAAFSAAGVPCAIGSDAHRPEEVGRDLDLGFEAMRAAGYHVVTVPTRTGDRRTITLR
ncbi:MAG: histidinol-phosphatase [Coriobacteriaceae bacterium]|nr:histidinol-phosphatase [Coriobacteriaceae bacterium]